MPVAAVIDLLGAALTLLTLGLLALCGTLLALRILGGGEARRDPLAFAIAAIVGANAVSVGIALVLGAAGRLRIDLALGLLALLTLALLVDVRRRRSTRDLELVPRLLARRVWARLREHPALSLIAIHALGSELLRGLLRPPLSWDSLMYHLLLAGRWLQEGNLLPVLGPHPTNFYGYNPANGSLWLWWWMAPSHSELYVNLAFASHVVLLGLAVGALARSLGARSQWPLASFLVVLTPVVARFAATQYVDVPMAALLLAALFFGHRWLGEPRGSDALLAGLAGGLAVGTKHLALPYAAALALMVLGLARGRWKARLRQLAALLPLLLLLGGFFYLRNVALGTSPLAVECERPGQVAPGALPSFPRQETVAALAGRLIREGSLLEAFLGTTRLPSLELGLGPQALLWLPIALALPWLPGRSRSLAWIAWAQVLTELVLWVFVPFAASNHVYANVRYLVPMLGLAVAAGLAAAEVRGVPARWLGLLGLALAIQDLLMLHAEMPRQVRVAVGLADLLFVAFVLSPRLRSWASARWRAGSVVAVVVLVLLAPALGSFRVAHREAAFARELTAHLTGTRFFASAWGWLDRHGGDGSVAVVSSPGSYFVYPAMGPHLERKAIYVNVNRADLPLAGAYPGCEPRVDASAEAWLANLERHRARWVHLSRYPVVDFPAEQGFVERYPERFALRFADETNRIYELLPSPAEPAHAPGP